ncbi:NAD(P)/FAD-dependent oxidoreductase [Variibacter gotjawalensis]|nr:FAD-dependent oxidoreductase [Variibacter gotjawalensis]NIK45899.1 D-amino-acid dehydrogenase [Variibacter gotjawalensis]
MARVDALVLGAGIVGVSTALQLVKRGLSVAIVDRQRPGEGTSYGNAGVLGGAGVYPTGFPRDLGTILRVGLKLAPFANYYAADLPRLAPWLWSYYRASREPLLQEGARFQRPLMANAVAEHEALMTEANALRYLRKDGWLTLYYDDAALKGMQGQLALGTELGVAANVLDTAGARALEPSLAPVFAHAIHWPDIASVSNPLGVTQAYAKLFTKLGGLIIKGDARSLHRSGDRWRVDTDEGALDSPNAIICLGPWAPDVLEPLGIRLPFAVKRGYHWHFSSQGNAALKRPVVDTLNGYVLAPMEQGMRVTTGAEFARRDAAPTPVQIDRVLPHAKKLYPLDKPVEPKPWMGARPCVYDMRPVIGRAPGHPGLWFNTAHNHYGLTLGPVTGKLLADIMTGATPVCDPAPFSIERFAR